MRVTRRGAVAGGLAMLAGPARARIVDDIAAIETETGGRIGVGALNTADGRGLRHRTDERFAMCSTFKTPLAAAVLARIERGETRPEDVLSFDPDNLLGTSRVTGARPDGRISVIDACEAVVSYSDNTAANLLIDLIGGPSAMTAFFRGIGDEISRLDRYELDLNANIDGDPRDTTTPDAMMENLRAILLGEVLAEESRERLTGWMLNEQNGRARIRAGLPADWRTANKPGTSLNGATNDIAVAWPPDAAPIVLAVYTNLPDVEFAAREAVIARVARLAAETVAGI